MIFTILNVELNNSSNTEKRTNSADESSEQSDWSDGAPIIVGEILRFERKFLIHFCRSIYSREKRRT